MTSQFQASSDAFHKPPLDYSMVYIDMVDYNVFRNPEYPVFQYLNLDGSPRVISWKEAGSAFNRAARLIQMKCDGLQGGAVVGILANTDSLTYISLILGIMLAGYVPFPISNRNSPAAVAHLLRAGECRAIVVTHDKVTESQIKNTIQIYNDNEPACSVLTISAPKFEDLYESTDIDKLYPPLKKLRDATHDSVGIIIHSSGSTAFPKPIKYSHRMILQQGLDTCSGEMDVCGEIFGAHGLPIYHTLGVHFVTCCVSLGMTLSLLPPWEKSLPSPEMVLTSAVQNNCSIISCVPSFIESWAQDPREVEILKGFKAVVFGGGSLSPETGDMLVKEGINIVSQYGATETGVLAMIISKKPRSEGWEWHQIPSGVDMEFIPSEMSDENACRLVVKTNEFKTLAVSNTTIDSIPAFDTNDLVLRHPNNPRLFKILGREDDQIIHSTGEKTNPTPIEGRLMKDPLISSAIMFGRSKFQPGVLIAPSPKHPFDPTDEVKVNEYKNMIWGTVEEANKIAPQHSRIYKELVLIASPSKPFEFTAKGTPRRHAILRAYRSEIEQIYRTSESTLSMVPAPLGWELNEVRAFLRTIVTSLLGHDIKDNESIFLEGGDSLAAVSIRNSIIQALRRSKLIPNEHVRAIPSDVVYMYSSVDTLSAYVCGFLSFASVMTPSTKNIDDVSQEGADPEDTLLTLVRAYKGPTVVKLRKGNPNEIPLIIIHGAGGTISPFLVMSEYFRSPLWAIQVNEETPFTSIPDLAQFYYKKIKEERPTGPYRLSGYCGSTLLLVQLVQVFEAKGDTVIQFDFLEYFPTVYMDVIDPSKLDSGLSQKAMVDDASRAAVEAIAKMVTDSSLGADKEFRETIANDMLAALDGKSTIELASLFTKSILSLVRVSVEFLLGDMFFVDGVDGRYWSKEKIFEWMRKVKKSPTLYVAKEGLSVTYGYDLAGSCAAVYEDSKITWIDGNHFSLLVNPELLQELKKH